MIDDAEAVLITVEGSGYAKAKRVAIVFALKGAHLLVPILEKDWGLLCISI